MQAFGNCPKYIRPREFEWTDSADPRLHPVGRLEGTAKALVDGADTFFIATHYAATEGEQHARQHRVRPADRTPLPGFHTRRPAVPHRNVRDPLA